MVRYKEKNSNPGQEAQPLEIGKRYDGEVVGRTPASRTLVGNLIVEHKSGHRVRRVIVVDCPYRKNGDVIEFEVTSIRSRVAYGKFVEK